ncbi:MAG: rhomboid family intramembrane serine protease, partial [Leptospiraceae bacterium]|nr:rhomboid family intramembrane serine protease [Leptospiraceae bacterium]
MSNYNYQVRFGPSFTKVVKTLIIINIVIFVIQLFLGRPNLIDQFFALHTSNTPYGTFYIWQIVTYSFLHGDFFHILFNMLTLWMFGSSLEEIWGKKNFLFFFLSAAIFGALMTLLVNIFYPQGWVVGASGGIFGIMVAYALIWPNREVLFMMIFPIKIKYLVFLIMIPMIFLSNSGNIAHMCHLGGALFGLFYWFVNKRYKFEFEKYLDLDDIIRRRKFKMYQEEMNNRMQAKDRVDELL